MRVSRAQAAQNREKVIDVASQLFREHGLDGIGLNDLMKAAGLTQGGFYKQFESKEDLAVQACERAMQRGIERWTAATGQERSNRLDALLSFFLRPESRDERRDGCPVAALASDVSRHGEDVKAVFEAGIEAHLSLLEEYLSEGADESTREKAMAVLATMVGALLLSRAVSNQALSKSLLDSAAAEIRRSTGIVKGGS